MKLYLVYSNNLDHKKILEKGYGASEFQFYMLSKKLADIGYDVTIFNTSNINGFLDNILYRNYDDIFNNIDIDKSAVLILMRFFISIKHLIDFYPSNNILIWSEDYIHSRTDNLIDNISIDLINNYNIKVLSVSNFHKNNLSSYFNINNLYTIYNILYSDVYMKKDNIIINKNNIVFASSWSKGLYKILNLFDLLYNKYPNFKLVLLRPNYNTDTPPYREYITLLDTIDNKEEYCSIIQSSLCTITTDFPETFGCVFAESYYLNTPVIATHIINGLHEYIDNNHICDLNNYNNFEEILMRFYNNRPCVSLSNNLVDSNGLDQWINILNNYQ